MSGSGIRWATCKSAPSSRQITTPAPHHSVFTGRMPFLPPNQQCQSTEGKNFMMSISHYCQLKCERNNTSQTHLLLLSSVLISFPLQFVLLSLSCHESVLTFLLLYQSLLRRRCLDRLVFSTNCCTTAKLKHTVTLNTQGYNILNTFITDGLKIMHVQCASYFWSMSAMSAKCGYRYLTLAL